MISKSNQFKLQGIAHLFVLEKLLEKNKAIEYLEHAASEKVDLIHYLVENNILSASQIAHTLAHHFGLPILDINCIKIDSIPINLVNEKLIRQHGMLPLFRRETTLYLATDDPSKQSSLKEIQFHTGLNIQLLVVETDKLHPLIDHLLMLKENQGLSECINEINDFSEFILNHKKHHLTEANLDIEDAPIVKFVNKILLGALKQRASDIHFEPFDAEYRIRYRQDGVLYEVTTAPAQIASRITARIKIMSNLDSSERRIPQDGGFKISNFKNHSIGVRVSTCPTTEGEKVVMRILDSSAAQLDIESLGFNLIQKAHFIKAIKRPQGMILVTGPTGSGKTVSMYTALNLLNTREVNISTVEDPVEIKIKGLNQVSINPKVGLTFSETLRSFLRQDPDIIMVGEIRDLETAEIVIKASQTGHLVLSTLHTNSAAETLTRLLNMGIPAFNIASSITLIIAQRLARKLCTYCKVLREESITPNLISLGFTQKDLRETKLYQANHCSKCINGYHGRVGLFEVLPMSKALSELIMSGGNSLDILRTARAEGMQTIYQSGIEKVKEGITTIEEVCRVTVDLL
jgi:type IV pilus assembly protein PilB